MGDPVLPMASEGEEEVQPTQTSLLARMQMLEGEVSGLRMELAEMKLMMRGLIDARRTSSPLRHAPSIAVVGRTQRVGRASPIHSRASTPPRRALDPRSARDISPARTDTSEVAGFHDEAWTSVTLPSKVKVEALPKLGRDKGETPYLHWKVDARVALVASPGISWILDWTPPSEQVPTSVRSWYAAADRAVFAQILAATKHVSVVGDKVRRLAEEWGSSRKAWKLLKDHYIRVADTNKLMLSGELQALELRERETMEQFLNRVQNLAGKFMDHGLAIPEEQLIAKVFSLLSLPWWNALGHDGKGGKSETWEEIKEKLLDEDTRRRQANAKADDALLPLGWTKKGAQGYAAFGSGEPSIPQGKAMPVQGNQPKGRWQPKEGHARGGGEKPTPSRTFVCFHCLKPGHGWNGCRTKPADWKPSAEDVERGMAKKRELEQGKGANKPNPSNGSAGAMAVQGKSSSPSSSPGILGKGGVTTSTPSEGRVTLAML